MSALQTARRVSAALFVAVVALLLMSALAHAQHSAYSEVVCRDASGTVQIEETVDPETEALRVRPTDYIRVVREGESKVLFGFGPLFCVALRSEPE